MVIPQVPEQLRRGPTLALRAVFAGIGRILMAADRPQAAGPPLATEPEAGTATGSRWRSLDQTGNVRLLSAEDAVEAGAAELTTAPAASSLPLARYDELSLASIRAHLRSLDTAQLRVLADYERRNAERPEVLGMLERRIDKLEAG
jgi:hypothetical protein